MDYDDSMLIETASERFFVATQCYFKKPLRNQLIE